MENPDASCRMECNPLLKCGHHQPVVHLQQLHSIHQTLKSSAILGKFPLICIYIYIYVPNLYPLVYEVTSWHAQEEWSKPMELPTPATFFSTWDFSFPLLRQPTNLPREFRTWNFDAPPTFQAGTSVSLWAYIKLLSYHLRLLSGGKSPINGAFILGKSSINGPFSMAMLVITRG